jgi:hypothetical protein
VQSAGIATKIRFETRDYGFSENPFPRDVRVKTSRTAPFELTSFSVQVQQHVPFAGEVSLERHNSWLLDARCPVRRTMTKNDAEIGGGKL